MSFAGVLRLPQADGCWPALFRVGASAKCITSESVHSLTDVPHTPVFPTTAHRRAASAGGDVNDLRLSGSGSEDEAGGDGDAA